MPVNDQLVPPLMYDNDNDNSGSPFNRTRSEYGTTKYRRTKVTTLSVSPNTPKRSQSARYKSTSPSNYHRPLGVAFSSHATHPYELSEHDLIHMRFGTSPGSNRRQTLGVDQWPTPQHSRVLNRFLQLPESEDYERQRNFVIDSKGCLVNRGDSFRRRSHTGQSSTGSRGTASTATDQSDSPQTNSGGSSRAHSPYNGGGGVVLTPPEIATLPPSKFVVLVGGAETTGKSALLSQFQSSESTNLFNVSTDETTQETKILVSLEGSESELIFVKKDYLQENEWNSRVCDGYLVVYAVDNRTSFRHAADMLRSLASRPAVFQRPTILVANKVDLERKRVVSVEEGRALAKSFECKFAEVSAALSHNTDKLMVGILAQMRQFYTKSSPSSDEYTSPTLLHRGSLKLNLNLNRRKSSIKYDGGAKDYDEEETTTGCTNISAAVQRILKRRGSRSCDNLFT